MTEKENFMMTIHGETPAWVPRYTYGKDPYSPVPDACAQIGPSFLSARRTPEGGFNIFGVEFIATAETGNQSLPKPGQFILDDITKWRDVIKCPDISDIDWEMMARKDFDKLGCDRTQSAVRMLTHVGYFQNLMNFMGFNEGLVAMHTEPEEVLALFEYLSDFYVEVAKKSVYYYKPDILDVTDDTATATNPFISPAMYRELVKPFHAKLAQVGTDAGIPVDMHNCGRCEDFIDDWLDFNICAWNPAQVSNDLKGIKAKYGNKLVICGGWDSQGPAGWPNATEETVRQAVRDCIDNYAEGGGFCFVGSAYGVLGDPAVEDKRRWITEEYMAYRETPYK